MSDKIDKARDWARREPDSIAFYIICTMDLDAECGLKFVAVLLDMLGADLTEPIVELLKATRRAKIVLAILDLNTTAEEQEQVLDNLLASGCSDERLATKIFCKKETLRAELQSER